jgi:hypothetical protein
MVVSVAVENPGLVATVDVYFGALLPDGDTVVFFTNLEFARGVGSLSSPKTWQPIVARVDLNTPFPFNQPMFFTHTWAESEPPGPYILFMAAVKAGALEDNSIDAGDIIALGAAPVAFAP